MISKIRPGLPIYAFTPDQAVYNQLALYWGTNPYLIKEGDDFEKAFNEALTFAKSLNLVKTNDIIVLVSGLPFGKCGTTNMIRVVQV